MSGSVYKIIELVGKSEKSWEDATRAAVAAASKSLRDVRVAELVEQDIKIENGEISSFRVRLKLSFKVEGEFDD
ncbi:dodecin family protein [bacterium]|nr:dodecin family protein [bacterium]